MEIHCTWHFCVSLYDSFLYRKVLLPIAFECYCNRGVFFFTVRGRDHEHSGGAVQRLRADVAGQEVQPHLLLLGARGGRRHLQLPRHQDGRVSVHIKWMYVYRLFPAAPHSCWKSFLCTE